MREENSKKTQTNTKTKTNKQKQIYKNKHKNKHTYPLISHPTRTNDQTSINVYL
jgi:hypothetical protein